MSCGKCTDCSDAEVEKKTKHPGASCAMVKDMGYCCSSAQGNAMCPIKCGDPTCDHKSKKEGTQIQKK